MKHDEFDLAEATRLSDRANAALKAMLFRKSKTAAPRKAKDVVLPAGLLNDDFFGGF